jgi:aminopeptidase N
MVRLPHEYKSIVDIQQKRIKNPDRLTRFEFVVQALSPDTNQRIAVFEKLKRSENRRPEPTALEALKLLHHPLRSDFSLRLIKPTLDLLPEIQKTGDIFFPKSWLDTFLSGHNSNEAKYIVNQWIESNPSISPNLKAKLLQSADMLFRAANKSKEMEKKE